jgi:Protein of unknown function (DUF2652)
MDTRTKLQRIFLILFDISGYTRFMRRHGDRFVHAEEVIGELLSTVIASTGAPFVLHEIAGDSVSFYVESDGKAETAREIWKQVNTVFAAFRKKERELLNGRACEACHESSPLTLKAVLHHGEVVITKLHGFTKIAGPDVILAHRLLKNSVPATEYVIVTTGFYVAAAMFTPVGAVWQGEECEGFEGICILVCYPRGIVPREVSTLLRSESSQFPALSRPGIQSLFGKN